MPWLWRREAGAQTSHSPHKLVDQRDDLDFLAVDRPAGADMPRQGLGLGLGGRGLAHLRWDGAGLTAR